MLKTLLLIGIIAIVVVGLYVICRNTKYLENL